MAFVNLLQVIYPVGSMYFSCTATSPSSIIGGTWSQITGAVLRLNSSGVGGYSGSDNKTLTVSQVPSHNHNVSIGASGNEAQGYGLQPGGGFGNRAIVTMDSAHQHVEISSTGGGKRFQSCHEPILSMLGDVLLKIFGGDIDGIR